MEKGKIGNIQLWMESNDIMLFDRKLPFSNPDTKSASICLNQDGSWGIFIDKERIKSQEEGRTVLLHECGHYATGTTHQVYSPFELIERHEYKADKWAILHTISAEDLDAAVTDGYTEIWRLAEHFGVTEDFMKKVVCWYTYGNLSADFYF